MTRRTLHGRAKDERSKLTSKYDRRAKLLYCVFAKIESREETRKLFSSTTKFSDMLASLSEGESFLKACVESIREPLKDDFVMEILGGFYLESCRTTTWTK